jgi:hypothetical protein
MTVGEILTVKDYDWMIHEHDSVFKVTDGSDGSTVHETNDLTDALTAFDYCAAAGGLTRVKKRTHATDTWYPISDAIEINAATKNHVYFQGVAGPMVTDVQIRPVNNTPAFILTGGGTVLRSSLQNLFLNHEQAGYTKNLVHLVDDVREVILSGLRFGSNGSGLFKGNGIGFELLSADTQQYEIKIENMIIRDLENAFYFNIQQADSGNPSDFVSSIFFDSIFAWNDKRVALATGVSGAKLMALDFDKVHYQYSASNPLTGGEAVYDFGSVLNSWWIRLSQCMTWDIPASPTAHNINAGATTDIVAVNSNIPYRVGGSGGISRVKYEGDWRAIGEGKFTTNGIVGQRDYNVSHGLGVAPRFVFVTNISDDNINRQVGCMVPESSIDSTKFTVRLADPPVAGTNNVKIHWRAFL